LLGYKRLEQDVLSQRLAGESEVTHTIDGKQRRMRRIEFAKVGMKRPVLADA